MDQFLKVIKSTNFIAAIILLVLILLTFILGPIFNLTLTIRIAISVGLLFILIIVILYNKMKAAQKAGQIEKSINSGADDQMQNISPEKKAEIEQFKKQLETAIKSLKNSKLGKGKIGKSALYSLPWYIIIGPPAAGKTTTIQNSGLDFPFGKDGLRGVGGTRNCDWFFATKGIFLDTAGRYVTEPEDKVEWLVFLETLKKNRRKKPVDGVIVALNVDKIINCQKNELFEDAKVIRQRIDELIENLGINFPVYFIFTKCDLIQGFVEYFGDFSETERSQIWGATLNPQKTDENPKATFESEFKLLSDRLFEIRTLMLRSPLKGEQRRKIFLFPYQFQSLWQKLTYLIGEVFQLNPYMDNPVFRGFYFTSGTQEGVPLDIAIKEIAKKFSLPELFDEKQIDTLETKHYFIKDLLNEIVIKDKDYSVGKTSNVIRKGGKLRLAAILVAVFLLALISFFSFAGYNGSKSTLEKIKTVSASFAGIDWNRDLLKNFKETENLQSLIEKIENGDANESVISFGMDRSHETLEQLNELYFKKTESFFSKNIFEDIVNNLVNFAHGRGTRSETIYNYLKSYLLIGNERARLDTSAEKYLSGFFSQILSSKYIDSNPVASRADKDSLRLLFANFTKFFVHKLADKKLYPVRNDNILVNNVRDSLQYKPDPGTIYARLKQKGMAQYSNDMSLDQMTGGRFSNVIESDYRFSNIFTADGWKNYFEEAIAEESLNPGKEDWVLGAPRVKFANKINIKPDEMRNALLGIYFNEYLDTWIQFLQSIKYKEFGNVPSSVNSLNILSDMINSPLINVFNIFSAQVKVISDLKAPPDSSNNFSSKYYSASAGLPNMDAYTKLVKGIPEGSGGDINKIVEQYAFLSGALNQVKDEQGLIKDYAVKVLNKSAVEFPSALQVIKGITNRIPALQRLFIEPVELSWQSVLNDAGQYLNDQWKSKVLGPFGTSLANAYPFRSSAVDAPIQDFKDFFNPQTGVIWSFFNQELSVFINKERWKVNQWENRGLNISDQMINSLKKADDISNTLFKSGDLGITFKLKPSKLPDSKLVKGEKPIVEQVYLHINGDDEYYKMGSPFWKDYNWPGNKGLPGARMNIAIRNYGNSDTKSFDGEWAIFKLFDQASSRNETSSQFELNWFFQKENSYNVTVSYLLSLNSSRNPFSKEFFKSFSLPSRIN